jgi:hypothetical protein
MVGSEAFMMAFSLVVSQSGGRGTRGCFFIVVHSVIVLPASHQWPGFAGVWYLVASFGLGAVGLPTLIGLAGSILSPQSLGDLPKIQPCPTKIPTFLSSGSPRFTFGGI